jgi:Flp pilus assembly protein TadG
MGIHRFDARRERGSSAVELAILAPVLFMIVFAIIGFGIAFMQVQTARTAVREGARTAAILKSDGSRYTKDQIQQATVNASSGLITSKTQVSVTQCSAPGSQAVVTYQTAQANGGKGITVSIPLVPTIHMNPTVTSQFMCEG